jgi:signal transduction histidine kinase
MAGPRSWGDAYDGRMHLSLRALLGEPRIENAPERLPRDWLLTTVIVTTTVLEIVLRDDLAWPAVSLIIGWTAALLMPWRRTKPLLAVGLTFGMIIAFDIVIFAVERGTANLWSAAPVLLILFSLFRWGSGHDMARALPFVLGAFTAGIVTDYTGLSDMIGGIVILVIVAESGLLVRGFITNQGQQITETKLRERQILARELHDTVAHHVSAIAIQAQAGQFLARQENLEGATNALEVIEEEAARALDEMRSMISTLREEDADVEMMPQKGIASISDLAMASSLDTPRVEVELAGDLDRLPASVQAAAYRLAQESVTNAVRHARNATLVDVRVDGGRDDVRVTVIDDGEPVRIERPATGFGLVGMKERASLLGGSVEAGPQSGRGWKVDAVLPRRVST